MIAISKNSSEQGAALVVVMLFILVISLVVITGLQCALMETKMSANYVEQAIAYNNANSKLTGYEQKIVAGEKVSSAEVISTDICAVTIYRISASASQGGAISNLQSTFAKVGDTSHCDPKPTILQGRQSWRMME